MLKNNFWLTELFNFNNEAAKGRTFILISAVFSSIITALTSGIFYTGFLLVNNINIVEIGIIGFIPFFANIFAVFSPLILERFKKRKIILAFSRITFYILNILGVTFVPFLNVEKSTKILIFIFVIFIANVINALFSSGYTVWHVNFLPENVRANYFSIMQIISASINGIVILTSSIIADALKQSGQEMLIMTFLRLLAFCFAIFDVFILTRPKEYTYLKTKETKLKNVIALPVKNKKFLFTMILVFAYTFTMQIITSPLDVYVVSQAKVSYTMINLINALFGLFLFLFAGFYKKLINKISWFKTFALTLFLNAPLFLFYSFLNAENQFWLFPTVRLLQHILGVGTNLAYSNFYLINLA
ncbi:MAG: hypothetical protein RR549_01855 [Oscillospiraceae bacterium]